MRMPTEEARARFRTARVARLATVGDDGVPHLVPVTFALAGEPVAATTGPDTVVTAVDHKPKSTMELRRLRNIRSNPRVCLLVDHYDDDWTRLWWVRADGHAEIADEGRERSSAVERLVEKYAPYRERPPAGPVVLIRVGRWTGWSS
jgi:PPOX class probable F420-dependent enzyme